MGVQDPEYFRRHYEKNKSRYKGKQAARRARFRRLVDALKDKPCADCGVQYPSHIMQFDHVRGTKKFNLSQAKNGTVTAALEEAEKCEVVCANCHFDRTYRRRASSAVERVLGKDEVLGSAPRRGSK